MLMTELLLNIIKAQAAKLSSGLLQIDKSESLRLSQATVTLQWLEGA